ncbi:putative Testicular acid phosphatase-like protein [Hypsibius exemplaris]|uniref:Testicular acid phosphatase-like protein n=1 Tax=Hypsibius exemplaris TaxID=2072580 RepID=A0A1W0WWC5_HYPEX|nr:putative Testicular acid phosphatase-like protein [Hypsibius exemplaris]
MRPQLFFLILLRKPMHKFSIIGLVVYYALPVAGRSEWDDEEQRHSRAQDLPSAANVKLILVGFRHGNRNPDQFFKNDTSHHEQWAWEGNSQLTSIGKRQAYSLGKFMRARYGSLVPDEFYASNVKVFTSSADRCQMTMQTFMAGFFPPKGRALWNYNLNWQPIPYQINDPLLRMYNVNPCPAYKAAYQPISDDNAPAAREWLNRDPDLVKYIAANTGFNASLSDLGDAADNIGQMIKFNVPLPAWVTNPTLPGYPPKDMATAIQSYAEAHQILQANQPDTARLMAGLWLDQIVTTLQQKRDGKIPDQVANFYAAHTETVLSLLRLLKVTDIANETPTSAGLVLEFTDVPAPAVRVIFHEPDPVNPDIRLAELKGFSFCAGQEWCPLDTFISNVKEPSFSDYRAACGLPAC